MSRAIQSRLIETLTSRGTWEKRQTVWYQMLKDGLPRLNKPFTGAADLHLPLADNAVEKLKPYYTVGMFNRQSMALFTSLQEDLGSACSAASECLDWNLRYESNYPWETMFLNHFMLGHGRGILKTAWDHKARRGQGRLRFEAIDPLFFIGQEKVSHIDDMDLFAHVKQVSVERYKRIKVYRQDNDFIELIRGGENQAAQWKEQEKEIREGLTGTNDRDLIILWETWTRQDKGWRVSTFAPSQPDMPVRPDFIYPLTWQGEPLQPFVSYQCEITDKGFYAPRGITEKVAPFESYGTKMWNQLADWLEYTKNPLFTREVGAALTNSNMHKLAPGQLMPMGVKPMEMPPAPFDIKEEINRVRMMSEETAQVPDFGVTPEGDQAEKRTATEMQYVGSFASQGIQYKIFINGLSEAQTLKRAWASIVKWGGEELAFFTSGKRKVLPAQAKHDNYLIEPNSPSNSWDQRNVAQRAVTRFTMLKGHPNIRQDELVKTVLEADDPKLVKRLFLDTGTKAADEREDEMIETLVLLDGGQVSVAAGEDHVTRLQVLFGKLQQLSMMGLPSTPEEQFRMMMGRQRMQEHIGQHLQALQQENPAMAKQFMGAMEAVDPMAQPAPGMEQGPPVVGPVPGGPRIAEPEPELEEALV